MTQHPSLKGSKAGGKFRSVLKRYEKIKELDEKDKWDEEKDSVYKLPKIKRIKFKVKKTKGPDEEKEGAEGADGQGEHHRSEAGRACCEGVERGQEQDKAEQQEEPGRGAEVVGSGDANGDGGKKDETGMFANHFAPWLLLFSQPPEEDDHSLDSQDEAQAEIDGQSDGGRHQQGEEAVEEDAVDVPEGDRHPLSDHEGDATGHDGLEGVDGQVTPGDLDSFPGEPEQQHQDVGQPGDGGGSGQPCELE